MLDFEKLDGFVVNLSDDDEVFERLKNALVSNEELYCDILNYYDMKDKQEWLLQHYIDTYKYVFVLKPNHYFVCTADLCTKNQKSELKLPSWVIK